MRIRTTFGSCGILLGFAVLGTMTRNSLTSACVGATIRDHAQKFADASWREILPKPWPASKRARATPRWNMLASPIQAPSRHRCSFAAVIAGFSKVLVGVLMRERR
jgi:hypothetical protein